MSSLTPSGYWGSDISMIHIRHDFISELESLALNCYARTTSIWDQNPADDIWLNRVHSAQMFNEEETRLVAENIITRVQYEIETTLKVSLNKNAPSVVRWFAGNAQTPHADKDNIDGTPGKYASNDLSAIVYLNDDYCGGEIYFPKQNFELKPPRNGLIFFPGDVHFLHGVREITSGIRYTIPSFWKVLEVH